MTTTEHTTAPASALEFLTGLLGKDMADWLLTQPHRLALTRAAERIAEMAAELVELCETIEPHYEAAAAMNLRIDQAAKDLGLVMPGDSDNGEVWRTIGRFTGTYLVEDALLDLGKFHDRIELIELGLRAKTG